MTGRCVEKGKVFVVILLPTGDSLGRILRVGVIVYRVPIGRRGDGQIHRRIGQLGMDSQEWGKIEFIRLEVRDWRDWRLEN